MKKLILIIFTVFSTNIGFAETYYDIADGNISVEFIGCSYGKFFQCALVYGVGSDGRFEATVEANEDMFLGVQKLLSNTSDGNGPTIAQNINGVLRATADGQFFLEVLDLIGDPLAPRPRGR